MAASNFWKRQNLQYHLTTLWLFTQSDMKTVLLPQTVFGVLGGMSNLLVDKSHLNYVDILARLPCVVLWVWTCLLLETISNQRMPSSILEDSLNKPSRPLPAGRLTAAEARRLLLYCVLPAALLVGYYLSVTKETLGLVVTSLAYNDLGGADEDFLIRNFLNAAGLTWFSRGATMIAAGGATLNDRGHKWSLLSGLVIFLTVQTQDLEDMLGDAKKGRKSLPLVLGESFARRSIAAMVMGCSFVCPYYWQMDARGYCILVTIGMLLSARVLVFCNVEADKTTWKVWCFWMALLYSLPFLKAQCTSLEVDSSLIFE